MLVYRLLPYEDFRVGVPEDGIYKEIFNSDDERFGGSGVVNTVARPAEEKPYNGLGYSINLRLPPLGVTILEKDTERLPKKSAQKRTRRKDTLK